MQQIPVVYRIEDLTGNAVIFQKLLTVTVRSPLIEPVREAILHGKGNVFRLVIYTCLFPVKKFGSEFIPDLQKYGSQFLPEMNHTCKILIGWFFDMIQPSQVADLPVHLWEKTEIIRCFVTPCLNLIFRKITIMSRIQFNIIKLCGIIFQFVLRTPGIGIFQLLSVPFGASNKNFSLAIIRFLKHSLCFRMIWR